MLVPKRFSRSSKEDDNGQDSLGLPTRRPTQAEINKQLRSWPPRRIASWTLIVAAVVIAVQHLVAHAGVQPLPISMGLQDFIVGYPMAGIAAIAGLMLVDPRPRI